MAINSVEKIERVGRNVISMVEDYYLDDDTWAEVYDSPIDCIGRYCSAAEKLLKAYFLFGFPAKSNGAIVYLEGVCQPVDIDAGVLSGNYNLLTEYYLYKALLGFIAKDHWDYSELNRSALCATNHIRSYGYDISDDSLLALESIDRVGVLLPVLVSEIKLGFSTIDKMYLLEKKDKSLTKMWAAVLSYLLAIQEEDQNARDKAWNRFLGTWKKEFFCSALDGFSYMYVGYFYTIHTGDAKFDDDNLSKVFYPI